MRPTTPVRLIGRSPQLAALRAEIDRVARSRASVLITGESGSGKELVARSIHASGPRSKMSFVTVNCAGLPDELLERELSGKLDAAHKGTVLLDDVSEMPLRVQGGLLRFLETGELQSPGADGGARDLNVRVIAATHRNLRDLITAGTFREDLYYRLNVIELTVPPLREHPEDVPELVNHFLASFASASQSSIRSVSPDAMTVLEGYAWPGNVRELKNLIERMVVMVRNDTVDVPDLPPAMRAQEIAAGPRRERRRTAADDLYRRLTEQHESFWVSVYSMYMAREITRATVRDVVRRGLEDARGNYTVLVRDFNMQPGEYKRFLNFLRKHDCLLPFKEYR